MTIYSNIYNNYSPIENKSKTVKKEEKNQTVQEVQEIQKERHISKEEATALLYQYKATEIMKNQVDTYFDSTNVDEDELSLQDFRDLNKALNRAELLRLYQKDERVKIQEKEQKNIFLWV